LRELVPWADKGRIEAVFINKRAEVWGVYDQERFEAEEQLWRTPNNRDLVDMVALYTLLRKGRVYLMSPEQMEMEFGPGNRHQSAEASSSSDGDVPVAAAIYRFAV
jgi:hypothetical protein